MSDNIFLRPLAVRKYLNWAILLLVLALILEIFFHLALAPNLRLSHIVIQGNVQLTDEELFQWTGIKKNESYFGFDEPGLLARLKAVPKIRQAEVRKVFPDTLLLKLEARQPLGLALVNNKGKTWSACFDSDGVLFALQQDIPVWDLPVLSGLKFEGFQAGMKFPEALLPLVQALASLQKEAPGLYRLLSEIAVSKNGRGSFDAMVYPDGYPVRVRLGEDLSGRVFKEIFLVLDLMKKEGFQGRMKEIDFRTDQLVWHEKRES